MSYIGKTPTIGNFQVCDAISVVNGQAAYTMQVDSVNVVPESANHMLVSLNGILQKPGSSFTVSGSTITFASALSTGDVIDFITLLGNVLDLGVPSDATVTNAKTNFVSTSSAAGLQIKGDGTTDGTLQLNCRVNSHGIKLKSPPHSAAQSYTLTFPSTAPQADKALITDGSGNLSFGNAGGGKILQVVTGTHTGEDETTSTSYQASSLSVDITPSATSSKVFVLATPVLDTKSSGRYMFATIYRDSTDLGASGTGGMTEHYGDGSRLISTSSMSILDSPNTTSSITYKVYFRTTSGQVRFGENSAKHSITAFEVSA